MDRRSIRRLHLHNFISGIHPVLLEYGPSVHPRGACSLETSRSVPNTPAIAPMPSSKVPSVHLTAISLLFLSWFRPLKIYYLIILASGIFASLGLRNVYKYMLNNIVSPIGHVVMNHQNQTRTNGT
jgi:hypothetical protein